MSRIFLRRKSELRKAGAGSLEDTDYEFIERLERKPSVELG
jgi:hypothetical protein